MEEEEEEEVKRAKGSSSVSPPDSILWCWSRAQIARRWQLSKDAARKAAKDASVFLETIPKIVKLNRMCGRSPKTLLPCSKTM